MPPDGKLCATLTPIPPVLLSQGVALLVKGNEPEPEILGIDEAEMSGRDV